MPHPALDSLLHPWIFMGISLSYLPRTLLDLLLARDLRTLLSWPRLRAAWFGRFWARVGPDVRANAEARVVPLLQGRVSHGCILPPPPADSSASSTSTGPHPPVGGTIIEVGPGSGMWTSLYTPAHLPTSRIDKIYGIEPNPSVHGLLRAQIAAAGLGSVYEIVPVGIEDLAASGAVAPGSADAVVTVMCLCSIPAPRHNIAQLYGYLKPGGRWYVYEHVRCSRSQGWAMRLYQAFLNLLWPHFIGGCEMGRDTAKWLREAGPWSEVDLAPPEDDQWYHTLPHVIGVLTK
ncbi:uncharacterized protein THITE_2109111 [Thermothielavioides terrestris NRRL 8126]|uniref:Methyltransferase type 11 domain-containing protein n=1 Tax=Thermothielavioides terrestris (strain ATCC 38088 / NRRL 8126) TaxID=578455 RepID=G2QTJ2_THETT|nr:uncharacterized protein THITE_2109111 [Thermothielavioides terrestris NRRL 8126]AEO63609.1 hypothetical protein THITE_2109111 [Thermothielavioides terrestris NRRL 8126]